MLAGLPDGSGPPPRRAICLANFREPKDIAAAGLVDFGWQTGGGGGLVTWATMRPSFARRRWRAHHRHYRTRWGFGQHSGLDVDAVRNWIAEHGGITGYPDATYVASAEVLEQECDILIPAALEGVINLENRDQSAFDHRGCKWAGDGWRRDILREKGCVIIPDMYANAGGVTVSI